MAEDITLGLMGKEDFQQGFGTFGPVTLPDGTTALLTKVGIHAFLGSAYLSAADFVGVDAGDSVGKAFVQLPSSGGTVDLSGLYGSQTWTTNPFTGLTKRITLIKGHDNSAFPAGWHDSHAHVIDFSGTATTIGNLSNIETKILFDSWNDGASFKNLFGAGFQIHATTGGTIGVIDDVAVALFAAAERTGGFRPIWAFNLVTHVESGARTNIAYGIEADTNNNDADVAISGNNQDQIGAFIAYGGGSFKSLFGFRTRSTTVANRWRYGVWLNDWSDGGIRIDQSPTAPTVTGPAVYLVPSTDGTNRLMVVRNATDTNDWWSVTQNGTQTFANNTHLRFLNVAGNATSDIFQGGDNSLYIQAGTSGNGILQLNNGTNIAIWSSVGMTITSGNLALNTGALQIVTGGSTTISTGTGTIKMSSVNNANSAAWIPITYAGTVYYVPGFTTNAP